MTPSEAITLTQNAVTLTLIVSAPLLLVAMVVGLLISLFQAITQIQEMTLTFVPKIVAMMLTLLFLSSWMITKLVDYTRELITSIPNIIH
ncbi:MAG: flagellar biosynthetic protein FliQ [Deltaproteobacteria bacterium HGW-Deltaproteobacteria-21]|jgi:flagellar biosynthetic protein FliQ|nr:flagellar biosynthesis protein FliQ [Pseudomonadota bacterium]MCG2824563.1 flagellar biosynthesis protein FliQ [Desulfobulbaceae bacterium]MDP2003105.1 flagellar biosynthesis protein FliQ [Desulfurivibrionaceae bacterium]PKN30330.1 MAG: flagellar biosynthetic protein FliQ [Deltaproteobacteria bacterium HGW-Deltaproteobacteria-21]MBU4228778.1 flagellar biosynthesis protein FliQ [Pseudomonadota bacterium]